MSERDEDHPEQLLAGYADGTLSDVERAEVEAHLSTCGRCRDESALAARAIAELQTIRQEPVPLGVMSPVREEIARRAAQHRPRGLSERVVLAAVGAVAAVFVALLATTVLPNLGASSGGVTSAGGAAEAASPAPRASGTRAPAPSKVVLQTQSTNYDDAALAALAEQTASGASTARFSSGTALADAAASAPTTLSGPLSCVARGAEVEPQDRLVRLIRAKYHGTPAYIAVFVTTPPSGQQTHTVLVWVVGTQNCDFLQFTSKRI